MPCTRSGPPSRRRRPPSGRASPRPGQSSARRRQLLQPGRRRGWQRPQQPLKPPPAPLPRRRKRRQWPPQPSRLRRRPWRQRRPQWRRPRPEAPRRRHRWRPLGPAAPGWRHPLRPLQSVASRPRCWRRKRSMQPTTPWTGSWWPRGRRARTRSAARRPSGGTSPPCARCRPCSRFSTESTATCSGILAGRAPCARRRDGRGRARSF